MNEGRHNVLGLDRSADLLSDALSNQLCLRVESYMILTGSWNSLLLAHTLEALSEDLKQVFARLSDQSLQLRIGRVRRDHKVDKLACGRLAAFIHPQGREDCVPVRAPLQASASAFPLCCESFSERGTDHSRYQDPFVALCDMTRASPSNSGESMHAFFESRLAADLSGRVFRSSSDGPDPSGIPVEVSNVTGS